MKLLTLKTENFVAILTLMRIEVKSTLLILCKPRIQRRGMYKFESKFYNFSKYALGGSKVKVPHNIVGRVLFCKRISQRNFLSLIDPTTVKVYAGNPD